MSQSQGSNGRRKTGKESRCPESGGDKEARKTEITMGDCIKRNIAEWKTEQHIKATGDCCWRT